MQSYLVRQFGKLPTSYMHDQEKRTIKKWLARIGIAGFLFFLIKGLIWLAVFAFAGTQLLDRCNR
ncbi:MAG: hypothetical protein ACK500_00360 [Flavobacteriales bacterium]|jgi:hypothetical protein